MTLAPSPDFRYVGLRAGPRLRAGLWASVIGAGSTLGAGLVHGWDKRLLIVAASSAVAALVLARARGPRSARGGGEPVSMAIVPWGVLIESDDRSRVLRWAGIKRVHLDMIHGRDTGTSTTKWSLVTVDTLTERLAGRAFGAVSLERLLVHLDAYASEAGHRVALDLDGNMASEGPCEPDCEPLISAARAYVDSAPASGRLDLPPAGYRRTSSHAGSRRAIEVLREVLRDRTAHAVDPRAFAAVVAAELHASELADELLDLVQSPHPVIAAVAKVAARKLGVSTARTGGLDDVAPFLMGRDIEALTAWQGAPT